MKIIKESVIIVILSSLMGLISGTLLSSNEDILYTIPILLLIIPALNSLIGDMSTVLVSRLTTHLYIGTVSPKIQKSERLKEDFYGLLITLLLSLGSLLLLGYFTGIMLGIEIVNPFLMIIIIVITILLLFCIMFITLFIGAIFLFKRGMDPNNFLIPFLTSLADFLTPLFLILFIINFI
ncbi:MAG: magnesium transporter [Candidatus Lokiarchaeota archaeon]|nr:magnesium transporter [Candidatus Lokiarchaeota archaeon]